MKNKNRILFFDNKLLITTLVGTILQYYANIRIYCYTLFLRHTIVTYHFFAIKAHFGAHWTNGNFTFAAFSSPRIVSIATFTSQNFNVVMCQTSTMVAIANKIKNAEAGSIGVTFFGEIAMTPALRTMYAFYAIKTLTISAVISDMWPILYECAIFSMTFNTFFCLCDVRITYIAILIE